MAVSSTSTITIRLPLLNLTAESFRPYGHIISGGPGMPDFSRPGLDNWRLPFSSGAPLRLQLMRYHRQQIRFSKLERHLYVTEARCPIGSVATVLIVGGDTDNKDVNTLPTPQSVRAFYMDGTQGVMFHQGIWHGLDCYPVNSSHADFLFLSDAETEDEIESLEYGVSGQRTQVIDFAESDKFSFELADEVAMT